MDVRENVEVVRADKGVRATIWCFCKLLEAGVGGDGSVGDRSGTDDVGGFY